MELHYSKLLQDMWGRNDFKKKEAHVFVSTINYGNVFTLKERDMNI